MRQFSTVATLCVWLMASSVTAQTRPGSPVQVELDAPGAEATPAVVFGGWALNWRTCRHVASVQLWRQDPWAGGPVWVPATTFWGPRPDVQGHAQRSGCAFAEEALGFSVVPRAPQPPGTWVYLLLVTDMQAHPDSLNWTARLDRVVVVR